LQAFEDRFKLYKNQSDQFDCHLVLCEEFLTKKPNDQKNVRSIQTSSTVYNHFGFIIQIWSETKNQNR